jgi:large subunit ribosomal protein L7/L12
MTRHSQTAAIAALGSLELSLSSADFLQRPRRRKQAGFLVPNKNKSTIIYRFFHPSGVRLEQEEGELSAKEKKQQLKAKLKAAMAEKEKAESDVVAESTAADDDPKANLKAKLEAKKNEQSSSSGDTKSTSTSGAATGAEQTDVESKDNIDSATATSAAAAATTTTGSAATTTTAAVTAAAAPPSSGGSVATTEYSYPELTADAAKHKAGLTDPTRPLYQNPLHHNNDDALFDKIYEEDFASKEEFEKAVLPAPGLADADGNIPAPPHIQELADEMVHLTMLEYNELVNKMADHFGFYDGQLGPDDDDGDGDDEEDEAAAPAAAAKTAFDVKLVSYDATAKIKIIKEIRTIVAGLGLKEAKALVESAPVTLQKGMSQEAADEVKKKLVELGAVVEIE